MNVIFVRHFIETYHAFDGDLVEAIVLGEMAHHNVAAMRTSATATHDLSRLLAGLGAQGAALLPTNAYSIAEASGIPRETVRRKVASLERRGLDCQGCRRQPVRHPPPAGALWRSQQDPVRRVARRRLGD